MKPERWGLHRWFKGRSIREKRPRRRDVIIIIIIIIMRRVQIFPKLLMQST